MRLFTFLMVIIVFSACSSEEKSDEIIKTTAPERPELSEDSKVFLGNRLFSEKTCITCHSMDSKKVGPSVVDIVRVYTENNASIEAFLKGNSKPIVDTTESQVDIMQANIDGFLKKITDEELNAISTYMLYVAE